MRKVIFLFVVCSLLNMGSIIGQAVQKYKKPVSVIREANEQLEQFEINSKTDYFAASLSFARYLENQIEVCDTEEDVNACRSIIYFKLALQKEKDADILNYSKVDNLESSLGYYDKVLAIYPENAKALQNRRIVQNKVSRLKGLEALAIPTNDEKFKFVNEEEMMKACTRLKTSFDTNPLDEQLCRNVLSQYKETGDLCAEIDDVPTFAYHCNSYGYPYLAFEILEYDILKHLDEGNESALDEVILHWANMIAQSNWTNTNWLKTQVKNANYSTALIDELMNILTNRDARTLDQFSIWRNFDVVYRSEYTSALSKASVLCNLLYAKGVDFKFNNELQKAEEFWNSCLELAIQIKREVDEYPEVFFKVASDLATLYRLNPELDRNGNKFDQIEQTLFDGKNEAYFYGNQELIRTFHATLGVTYYDKKRFTGGRATNARFQLERALSEEAGPISNPALRKMLAEVYETRGDSSSAYKQYVKAIEDYLSLDNLSGAQKLLASIKRDELSSQVADRQLELKALDTLLKFRKELKQKKNYSNISRTEFAKSSLRKWNELESELSRSLNPQFVAEQLFKGIYEHYSSSELQDKNITLMFFTEMLSNIEHTNHLASLRDYQTIIHLQQELESLVIVGDKLQAPQLLIDRKSSYTKSVVKNHQVYAIDNTTSSALFDNNLFKVVDNLQVYYSTESNYERVPEIYLSKGRVRVW